MARLTRRHLQSEAMGAGLLGAGAAGVLAACGEPDEAIQEVEKVAVQEVVAANVVTVAAPAGPMTGMILADGSSTVGPVTQAVAEEFRQPVPRRSSAGGRVRQRRGLQEVLRG